MRTRNSIYNIVFSLIHKVSTILFGFIVAKLILITYGSAINGMLASIRQFISYLTLLEMGIAGASIYALYKPLSENDDAQISKILVEAKRYYFKSGIAFTVGCVILSIIYPFIVSNSTIKHTTIFLIFLILSVSTAMDFFAFAKYRVIFTADQKEYIISICNIIYLITYSILTILVIKANLSIIIMQLTIVIAYFIRSGILFFFYRKIYGKRFDLTVKSDKRLVTQKSAAMIHEISWLVLSSMPMVVMTFFYSFNQISVYSVYNMIVSNIVIIISIFNSAFTAGFGELLSKQQYNRFSELYHQFEFMYFSISGFLLLCTLQLIQPFVDIYTQGITDVSYNNKTLVIFMILLGISNSFRVPSSIIIGITGSYKQTIKPTVIVTIICIILSSAFAFINFELILVGSIISYIIKGIVFMRCSDKLSIGYNLNKSIKNIIISIIIFVITFYSTTFLVDNNALSYFKWIQNSMKVTIGNIIFYIVLMILLNRDLTLSVFRRFKLLGKGV